MFCAVVHLCTACLSCPKSKSGLFVFDYFLSVCSSNYYSCQLAFLSLLLPLCIFFLPNILPFLLSCLCETCLFGCLSSLYTFLCCLPGLLTLQPCQNRLCCLRVSSVCVWEHILSKNRLQKELELKVWTPHFVGAAT
jgi:hypothetical protein